MESPTAFDRCIEISETNVARAIVSRQAFRALLDRAAAVSRPEDGGPKVLVALARLATTECVWLEGDLRIEVEGDDHETTINVLVEMGYGYRERVFPTTRMRVPFDEFVRAVRLVPRLIAPLRAQDKAGRLFLTAGQDARRSTAPPPPIDIDEGSLLDALAAKGASSGKRKSARPAPAPSDPPPTIPREVPPSLRHAAGRQRPSSRPTVARMAAVRPELHTKPTVARMAAVRPDVHSRPTVARMAAIRLEDLPEARREDQADIDEAWEGDE